MTANQEDESTYSFKFTLYIKLIVRGFDKKELSQ